MPPKFSISGLLVGPAGEDFFRGFTARTYAKGVTVETGEDDLDGVLVVLSGGLRMYLAGDDREINLFHLGPGDMFCLHSGCVIEATERTELRIADIEVFQRKLVETPQLAWGLVSILGRALASFRTAIEDLMFRDVRQRIARFFLDRALASGAIDEGASARLEIGLTVEEIAKYVGSSRPTTSTSLNGLIRDRILERHGRGSYGVPDLDRLRAAAGDAADDPA